MAPRLEVEGEDDPIRLEEPADPEQEQDEDEDQDEDENEGE